MREWGRQEQELCRRLPQYRPVFIEFLYCRHGLHLENLCEGGQVSARWRVLEFWVARCCRGFDMSDIIMLALGCGFFAMAIAYTYVCERL